MNGASTTQVASREICESLLSAPAGLDGAVATASVQSEFVRRYEAYRNRLRFDVASSSNRCDAYAVSSGMVMAVVDVGCTDVFESRLSGQDIVEFHYRISGSILLAATGASCVCADRPIFCGINRAATTMQRSASVRVTQSARPG